MTSFEAGFVKYAMESGLSANQAAQAFKRASDHPGVQAYQARDKEDSENNKPSDLEVLANLLRQELIDAHYSNIKKKIEL